MKPLTLWTQGAVGKSSLLNLIISLNTHREREEEVIQEPLVNVDRQVNHSHSTPYRLEKNDAHKSFNIEEHQPVCGRMCTIRDYQWNKAG